MCPCIFFPIKNRCGSRQSTILGSWPIQITLTCSDFWKFNVKIHFWSILGVEGHGLQATCHLNLQAPPRITLVCRKKRNSKNFDIWVEQSVMILWSYITKVKLQYPHVTLMLQYMQTKFCSRLKKNLHLGLGCAHQCGSRLKEARSVTKWQILLRFNGGAALTSVKSFLGFRVIFFISSFFNWSSLPQMNGMPYRRRPSQSGWTSTWKRWDIVTLIFVYSKKYKDYCIL